jgi:4-amino-4-deoxy-L-arabinose transferase-like glycosyltransferase
VPLAAPRLVQEGTTEAVLARDACLRPAALALDGLLVGLMALAFGMHVWSVGRSAKETSSSHHGAPSSPRPPNPLRGANIGFADIIPRAERGGRLALAERALLTAYFVVMAGWELLHHLHLYGRAIILSGGNDWLAYESFARDILINGPLLTEGRALGQGVPFYYQPLYIYWVAATHLVLGESLFAPLFMNAVLGIAAGIGLYFLTRYLFGRAAALVALPLFEVCRLTVFAPTAGLLLSENLVIPLIPILLLVLARLALNGRVSTAAGAGLLFGLAGLARTTPLALLPPAVLILLVAWRRLGIGWRGIVGRLALLVLVCTLTLGLATTRNYVVSGRPVPITSSAGANLWETHRPSSRVDLSRIDNDPLYERLGLDRQTREVVEFARQDPAGYVGTLTPMFLFALGVVGAIEGRWDVQPLLFGLWVAYLLVTLLSRRARALPTWFLHAFVWSHLAQMTAFFSHQYGFRLILPMYVAMVPVVALGVSGAAAWLGRRLAPFWPRRPAGAPPRASGQTSPVARIVLLAFALVGGAAGIGAGEWRSQEAAREAFYGLNGDAALATRQAARPDLLRQADATYFVGDDSRSTDVAYLSGLAYPTLRWFDGARGLVLPPAGQQALYVVPDRAAADLAKRCLGEGASLGRERDAVMGAGLELFLASAGAGDCAEPREQVGAAFAETLDATARLIGLDGPASIEPGRAMDVMIHWETLGRPRNRARPFVRLVDSRGRRWGQAETAVFPSSAWHPGERAIGLARLDVDPTLPPGQFRLEGGISAGNGQQRVLNDGPWGSSGLVTARGPNVRLVSRSTPLAASDLPVDRRLNADLNGARLVGVGFDRDSLRAGERLRVGLFWQGIGTNLGRRVVSLVVRGAGGEVLQEYRGEPVDGTYPTSAWRPGEIVRDTWDVVLPSALPAGPVELAAGLALESSGEVQYVSLGNVAVQAADRELKEPELRARVGAQFEGGAELVGLDYKGRRFRAGDQADLTLVWRASGLILGDRVVSLGLLDEAGRVLTQQDSEPAGGKRPTSGWTTDEYVEDGWKLRIPRDLPSGRARLAVSLVDPATNQRVPTTSGQVWAELPAEVGSE